MPIANVVVTRCGRCKRKQTVTKQCVEKKVCRFCKKGALYPLKKSPPRGGNVSETSALSLNVGLTGYVRAAVR